ncbi:hypothetical protein P154DRAFT_575059 [Amniculicola lignicola CBS 123094]|uniref:Uncharacterized protein n=1 Tax=Amniculicola lignicola CBS 123094 TaxID=1392246 RepID=A0A6A5WHN0_9PLEO|nr:hypothetical protein P154DRAFT_575059 [Amniculicola lignicola CBS 123094]
MSGKRSSVCVIGMCVVAGGLAQTTSNPMVEATSTVPFSITPAPSHPPIPTPNIPALPSEFSNLPPSVVSCWDAHANYSSASYFLANQLYSSSNFTFSEWSTTSYSFSTWINEYYGCSTTLLPSLTTLCDGYPRASTAVSSCKTVVETYTFTLSGTGIYYTPEWSTELQNLPSPTCTIASDFGPECSGLKDAYNWRKTQLQSQVPTPTGSIQGPECSVLNSVAPSAKPTCYLEGGSWEGYYWPKPIPTGSAFCEVNGTDITATPTIPGQANTAVISGLTLTSPSVYHFLRNATLQTFAGRASSIGEISSGDVAFSSSTSPPLLVVSQRESDILTIFRNCAGSGRRRACTFHASPGFSIADLETVRASEYCGRWGCYSSETIFQDDYKATIGVAMSEIVAQNKVFSDCAWTTPGAKIRSTGPPAYNGGRIKAEDWHKLTVTTAAAIESRETAAPGMSVQKMV